MTEKTQAFNTQQAEGVVLPQRFASRWRLRRAVGPCRRVRPSLQATQIAVPDAAQVPNPYRPVNFQNPTYCNSISFQNVQIWTPLDRPLFT